MPDNGIQEQLKIAEEIMIEDAEALKMLADARQEKEEIHFPNGNRLGEQADLIACDVAHSGFLCVLNKTYRVTHADGAITTETRESVVAKSSTVSALVVHVASKTVWLTRQFRAAIPGWFIALPAGYVDEGEHPIHALVREVKEEVGVKSAAYELIAEFYSSPGWADEFNRVYLCIIIEEPDASKVHGLVEEGERIELIPMGVETFIEKASKEGTAKTIIAAQWLALNRERLGI